MENYQLTPSIIELFQVYVMNSVDPGEFYHLDVDLWKELLPEARYEYTVADLVFPFTEDDADTIRATIDRLLEDEFGVEAMADYEKNCR